MGGGMRRMNDPLPANRRDPRCYYRRGTKGDCLMMRKHAAAGFTLIELMVVVAIVAIIAALAMPSYTEQVHKSRRADAARAVGQLQLELERWRAEQPTYINCKVTTTPDDCSATPATYPAAPTSDFYTIAISGTSRTAYTITATPSGTQVGDRCGKLIADLATKKTPTWDNAACN
jgi:type IV pilus assembly protein PilE